MTSFSGSDQPVTQLEYSEPRCCQCSQQSHCNRDEYCACHSKHVHCTNCLADSCTNRNILLGPAVEVQVPPCHHPPPQVSHGTLPTHLPPQVSHGTLSTHPPPQVSHGTLSTHPPPQVSHGTLSTHPPPQVSHGTLPAHLPPQVSHGTLSTHLPPQVSHGTLSTHLPPQVSHGTLSTHPPPQVSHGTLPAHLPPEVWSSQRHAPLPPPSLAHGDISWNRFVQSEPSRSSFNTSGNQATPSPHQPMLASHSGGQTEYILYPSLTEIVSGSQSSSSSPAQVNPSWNQVTTLPFQNLPVVQPETLVRYFNPSSSQLSPQGMQTVYTRSEVAPVHPTGNRTIVLPHQSSWTQVAGSQPTRQQQLHVDAAYTQDSLFQPSVSRVLPSGSHTTPALSRTVLARAPSVQATHLQPSLSQVSPSPNQDTPLTSKVSAVTSSGHRESLVSPLSSQIILSGRLTFPQSATPALSSGDKQGDASVHDAQFVSSDAAITGAGTLQSDKSTTSSPASQVSGGSQCCKCTWRSRCKTSMYCACHAKKVRCTNCIAERCSNREIVRTSKLKRCCECTVTSQCNNTRSCDCLSKSLACTNCVAENCSNIKCTPS
ncbi:polycystin-1-like protein 3 [Littorina saxatilis]|uniref:polycystin-1-like protein 3 n=1 Tax=Littorina saxatilis TaxID=31220 RepID=UPI0038B5E837